MNLTIQPLLLALALSTPGVSSVPLPAPHGEKGVEAPRLAAGLFVFTDPATGELLSPPDDAIERRRAEMGLADWSVDEALRTDSADLVVEADAFGALSVDLRGRFQAALYGRVAADGTTAIEHVELSSGAAKP